MKKYVLALLLMSIGLGFTNALIAQQFTLTGKVFDKATGKTLAGASVYLPEIKKGTLTNKEGIFTINIEQGSHVLEISYMGYATDVENIKLQNNLEQNFYLNSSVLEGGNVIVTSFLRATSTRRTPTPVTIIKKEELFRGVSSNLIDALSKVPGVSQISTGPAISKPIIRGLGYNRVVVMHDGIRQEGQQWGDEHGIEIDEYNVSRTEVLKVPASLIYGCIPSMAFIFLATSTSGCPSSSLFKILAVRAFWMFLMAAVLATAASLTPWASESRAEASLT